MARTDQTTERPNAPTPALICPRCAEELNAKGVCRWCAVYDGIDLLPKRQKKDQRYGA